MARKIIQILKSHIRLSLIAVLLAVVVITIVVRLNTKMPSQRDLWNAQGISNYQMRVNVFAPPMPPIGLDLTIQGGEITKQSIIACDNPSEEYPENLCDPITRYYSAIGRYTINQLFDLAEDCALRTKLSLATCPIVGDDFKGFTSSHQMYDIAKTCRSYLQNTDWLCTVEYDPTYGYPNLISVVTPNALDGNSIITVKEFHAIQ